VRLRIFAVVALMAAAGCQSRKAAGSRLSVCEIAADLGSHRGETVAVRGVYNYFSLRQTCDQKCSGNRQWPSFIDLTSGPREEWDRLVKAQEKATELLQSGKHAEIRVTVVGTLHARDGDPCDWKRGDGPGYGHLNSYPAEIEVKRFYDVELVENEGSPLSYGWTPPGR
jgi:hypothetical protein